MASFDCVRHFIRILVQFINNRNSALGILFVIRIVGGWSRAQISIGFRHLKNTISTACLRMIEFLPPLGLTHDKVALALTSDDRNFFLIKRVVSVNIGFWISKKPFNSASCPSLFISHTVTISIRLGLPKCYMSAGENPVHLFRPLCKLQWGSEGFFRANFSAFEQVQFQTDFLIINYEY